MLQHWIWFAEHTALTGEQKRILLEYFSDPEEIYLAQAEDLPEEQAEERELIKLLKDKKLNKANHILNLCVEKNIQLLTYRDRAYPYRLRNIPDPPMVLYYVGNLPDFEAMPTISVVGTRKATTYGLSAAKRLSGQIAACGALVVSGAANGIDAMAMWGALEAGKPVVGVLGCGVDVVYPKTNIKLFSVVRERGCLISEYPPGAPPLDWHFPIRNRIISGMANGVLVVEAPERSGALITARKAFHQGREVFVVPGNIDTPACAGSNALLKGKAAAVFSGWDVVKEYLPLYPQVLENREVVRKPIQFPSESVPLKIAEPSIFSLREKGRNQEKFKKEIDKEENSLYSGLEDTISELKGDERTLADVLGCQPMPIDEAIAKSGLPTKKALSVLTMLAIKGIVENHPGNCVSLKTK